ncbi:MAG: PEP-CTERM sorting domain-containing protein [Armatimonadetes bacterium]|nr:PEP-CTERM sorting domain-containing protein [Armatimonadota bacterium]NOG39592.1 PEP-CTERM sorting domain-containing protein [Armatimonadota bacterium]GIK33427.1 MAG: hypothetical protein BroJett009_24190 [Armatimonadota bacterium]
MTLNKGIRLAAVLVGVGSTMGAFAQIYNFRSDFSITNGNPNGAWTYGWQTGLGSAFTAYADSLDNGSHTLWYTTGMSGDNTPSAFLNHSGGTINGVLDGEAGLHGGYYGEMSVARLTVENGGTASVSGVFGAGDSGAVDVHVVHNGSSLLSTYGTYAAQAFDFDFAVSAGDTIDFVVGTYDGYHYDSTPLDATIEVVPEPVSLSLYGLGLGVATLLRRRRVR